MFLQLYVNDIGRDGKQLEDKRLNGQRGGNMQIIFVKKRYERHSQLLSI